VHFQKPGSLERNSIFIRLQRIRAKIIGVTWWGQMHLHYFSHVRIFFGATKLEEGQIDSGVRVPKVVYVYYGLVHVSLPHLT
jgi:hypothetical protein